MKTSPVLRLLMMGVLLVALQAPLTMMCGVVSERTSRRDEVAREVAGNWGNAQVVAGPVLTIPYRYLWDNQEVRPQADGRSPAQGTPYIAYYNILPEQLEITGNIESSERRRTLFKVIVYTARLKVRGRFPKPVLTDARAVPNGILWDQATVNIGVSDPKGIARPITLTWNDQQQPFVPGAQRNGMFDTGVHAPAPGVTADRTDPLSFEFDLELRGTREIKFIPSGNETTVRLASPWPHPSFIGMPPDTPRIDAQGFEASWRVPYFGRGFPPAWKIGETQQEPQLAAPAAAAAFGVALVQPVDLYVQTDRATKYAALFIVMTFVIAFLWEITGSALVHPIQYLFVGFAMCVFYLLLLSLAEHVGFDVAYVLATAATVLLLAWYWSWVLGGRRQGLLMGMVLTLLYGYLYLLLRLEDYALLAGSIGVFVMLAIVMFLTRRVNWFELRLGGGPPPEGSTIKT
jgi:inner membrane protein